MSSWPLPNRRRFSLNRDGPLPSGTAQLAPSSSSRLGRVQEVALCRTKRHAKLEPTVPPAHRGHSGMQIGHSASSGAVRGQLPRRTGRTDWSGLVCPAQVSASEPFAADQSNVGSDERDRRSGKTLRHKRHWRARLSAATLARPRLFGSARLGSTRLNSALAAGSAIEHVGRDPPSNWRAMRRRVMSKRAACGKCGRRL